MLNFRAILSYDYLKEQLALQTCRQQNFCLANDKRNNSAVKDNKGIILHEIKRLD